MVFLNSFNLGVMKWEGGRKSTNVQDRRGMSGGQKVALGGVGGIVVLIIGFLMGGDPGELLSQFQMDDRAQYEEFVETPEEKRLMDFSQTVLASTEDVWNKIFEDQGQRYPAPEMVVYRDGTETGGCGYGQSSFGPFYCPADNSLYLDLRFNQELATRFGAKGEFALAYVIAHEVGHHLQNVFGVLSKTHQLRTQLSEGEYNKVSVMTELQADFYAGVWAHYINKLTDIEITYDDIIEGMRAAAAVGDDRLQEQATGRSNPETFTHGTSQQRAYWFKKGYDTGDLNEGDTFSDPSLQ